MPNKANGHAEVKDRRDAALDRKVISDNLSPETRLAELDKRLGVGIGAKRERARLTAQIEPQVAPKKKGKK